jgi:5'-nucleotidase
MSDKPFILITNDDGVHAPGIRHLWQSVQDLAEVVVVAPAHEQSAVGLSITIRRPLHIEKMEWQAAQEATVWSVNGTPADCVKLALSVILPRRPDLIISGINRGTNAGRNVLYSGTVAGVIEGVLQNIPGIAFSIGDYSNTNYNGVEHYIPGVIQYVLEHSLPQGTFLNVNFPKATAEGFKGMRLTRQGKEYWVESPEQRHHPIEGSPYYWLGAQLAQFEENEESDIFNLRQGYATAVPIHVSDLTHHAHLEQHRELFENLVNQNKMNHASACTSKA